MQHALNNFTCYEGLYSMVRVISQLTHLPFSLHTYFILLVCSHGAPVQLFMYFSLHEQCMETIYSMHTSQTYSAIFPLVYILVLLFCILM